MAAVVSRTCVAPLERVKMDMVLNATGSARATATQVFNTEGLRGFWRGNWLNVLRTAPFKALNFLSYEMYHNLLEGLSPMPGNAERFAAGALAGITATVVCFPLDVIRTRIMATAGPGYGGPLRTALKMVKHEGVRSLYSGCLPAMMGMAPAGAVYYGVYDMLKSRHLAIVAQQHYASGATTPPPHNLDAAHMLLFGGLSGASSELVVYPLEVIRRRMQLQSMAAAIAVRNLTAAQVAAAQGMRGAAAGAETATLGRLAMAMSSIFRAKGLRGFYVGLVPNILQVLPSGALSYYTYDTMKSMLQASS